MPTDIYASHLPVLKALSTSLRCRRILEFGSGLHSTPFFLGLPKLERLVSVESDPEWYEKMEAVQDERLDLRREFDGPLDFDLVFIDDGKSAPERLRTIRWVLGQEHPPVVIHDAEVPEYARAMAELSATPATAVLCAS